MGTGGSRYGAGRPATHVKAEHCRRIDVRRWQREGILQAGRAGAWQWSDPNTGKQAAAIGYRANGSSVTLNYSIDGKPTTQIVWLTETACNYGGDRQWFTCPIRSERVAVLFLRAGRFACRHCQRIRLCEPVGWHLGHDVAQAIEGGGEAGAELGTAEGHALGNARALGVDHFEVRGKTRSCAGHLRQAQARCLPVTF